MIKADLEREPQFSQPWRQITIMLFIVGLVGAGGYFAYPSVSPIFMASPYLNSFIVAVFFFGLFACFWQLLTLVSSVSWIEGFALDRPGHEFVRAPGLLASLSALLRKRGARSALTSTSTRSILDSVATRLDEGRDLTRYIVNLLIFLGLLGTFYGLATTVPAVVETIRSLAPQEGQDSMSVFDNLMTGLEKQLGGMGTAFGSSLLGLAGSLVVGLLDLFAGHGQNRFFRELEEWLSSITRIGLSSSDGEGADADGYIVAELLEHTTLQLDQLRAYMQQSEASRQESSERLQQLTQGVLALSQTMAPKPDTSAEPLQRIASGQDQIVSLLTRAVNESGTEPGLDEESRLRLRNIDTQLLRVLEEMAAGRQDTIAELRKDLAELAKALYQTPPRRDRE